MHVAAVGVGGISKLFVSDYWLHWITVCSFLLIGIILIYMGITEEEEHEEFDEKLKNIEVEMMSKRSIIMSEELAEELNKSDADPNDPEKGTKKEKKELGLCSKIVKWICYAESVKIIATIICTEMADRSQISAIALAANYDFWIVAVAGSVGHIFALILAILFGKAVSSFTSEKCINICGGILFLVFSAYSFFFD